jgi:tRNA (cytidine/uridine-2'-O-)-methyltransferase
MRLALFQPDIPQNAGAIIRLAACTGIAVDIIEPCGFVWSETRMRRAGMDYIDLAAIVRHTSWNIFRAAHRQRLVLLTTKAATPYTEFVFHADDTLLLGQETAGVPEDVHQASDGRVVIPMASGARSLNIALAASMVLGEALRQTDGFPELN